MANPKQHNPRKRTLASAASPTAAASAQAATHPWAGMSQAEMIADVVTRTMGTPYAADPATGNLIVLADRRSGGGNAAGGMTVGGLAAPNQPGYTVPQGYDVLAGRWGAGSWPLYGAGQGYGNAVTKDGRTLPIPPMPQISPIDPDLHDYGASGTSFFGGLIQNDEYDPEFAWRDAILKYEQMRRNDGQIRAVEKMLTLPLLAAKWSVKPASDSLVDQEIASFVESCLFHDMVYRSELGTEERQTWPDVLRHALLMLFYGFMPFELVYRIEGDWVKWARWQPLLPRTVWRWWVGPDNALEGIQQWAYRAYGYQFTNVPRGKLVLFVNDQEGQNYEGRSVLRTAFKHWWILQNIEKIAAIAIERNGIVPPVFTLGQNATPGDVTAALKMGANLRANEQMAVVVPHDWRFEYPRLMENHAAAILPMMEYQDTKIARSILASFLMNGGSSQHGTQAMDQSQVATFLSSLQAVAEQIGETAQEPIRRLVDYNFEGVAMYPTLECAKLTASNLAILKDIVPALAAYLPPGDELNDFFADLIGVPRAPRNPVEATNPSGPDNGETGDTSETGETEQQQDQREDSQPANGDDAGAGAGEAAAEAGDGMAEPPASLAAAQQPQSLSLLLQEAMASALDLDPVERGLRHLARAESEGAISDATVALMGGHEKGYEQNRNHGKFATGETTLNPAPHHPRETRAQAAHARAERASAERTVEGMHQRAVAERKAGGGGSRSRGGGRTREIEIGKHGNDAIRHATAEDLLRARAEVASKRGVIAQHEAEVGRRFETFKAARAHAEEVENRQYSRNPFARPKAEELTAARSARDEALLRHSEAAERLRMAHEDLRSSQEHLDFLHADAQRRFGKSGTDPMHYSYKTVAAPARASRAAGAKSTRAPKAEGEKPTATRSRAGGKRTVSDEEFRGALVRAHVHNEDGSGFSSIRQVSAQVARETGLPRAAVLQRMDATREAGDRGEHDLRLRYEPEEDVFGRAGSHEYRGHRADYLEMVRVAPGADGTRYQHQIVDSLRGNAPGGTAAAGVRGISRERYEAQRAAKQGGGTRAPKEPRTAKAAKAAPAEDMHARSARLQREGGLREEVKPGHAQPLGNGRPEEFSPYRRGADRINSHLGAYGEHQIGAVLHATPRRDLQKAAREFGLPAGGKNAELASRITAHVTEGRYSANFGGVKATGTARGRAKSGTAKSEHEALRAEVERLRAENTALKGGTKAAAVKGTKTGEAKAKASSRASRVPDDVPNTPAADSRVRDHLSHGPFTRDAHEVWSTFGGSRASVYGVLKGEPSGAMEELARGLGVKMPRLVTSGKDFARINRYRLATAIADHLHAQFGGESQ